MVADFRRRVAAVTDGATLLLEDGRSLRLAGIEPAAPPMGAEPGDHWPRTGTIADRPRVMYCDHCHTDGAPVSVGREGMTSLLMELAGGRNIFDDIPNSYVRVSWEEMVRRDPQWIIVSDHRVPAEAAIRHLLSAPQPADVEAVRKRQFIVLTYAEQTPSTRNVEALERMARTLHPERFAP
ncbi:ABC transporter substrate-binding protein [Azospirillum brasilense]|uniref:ABC transporter substrate-binding protein n=1 Tax=Azospirillum brasilense TaxID=192 RepID=UPI003CE49A38